MKTKLKISHDSLSLIVSDGASSLRLTMSRSKLRLSADFGVFTGDQSKSFLYGVNQFLESEGADNYGEKFLTIEEWAKSSNQFTDFVNRVVRHQSIKRMAKEVVAKTTSAATKYEYPEGMTSKQKQAFRAAARKAKA